MPQQPPYRFDDDENPTRERMRPAGRGGWRRNPSADDMKVRRRQRRATAAQEESTVTTPGTRGELLAKIASASSLHEQAALIAQLDELDRETARTAAMDRQMEWADTVVTDTLRSTGTFEFTSAASDWLPDLPQEEVDHSAIVAQAGLWFSHVPAPVREDETEFTEQAKGRARHLASAYGEAAGEVERTFTDYATFLRAQAGYKQAASGLDQIQQTTAPDGVSERATPLPPDVFDNFAPPVHELNAGVDESVSSERNPLLQEIVSGGDGGSPEKPGGHSTGDDLSWNPGGGGDGPSPTPEAGGNSSPEEVGGHTDGGDQDQDGGIDEAAHKRQAASSLPQIQQTVDVHDQPAPTPLPTTVAFPWEMGNDNQDGMTGEAEYDQGGQVPSRHTTSSRQVTADMFGADESITHPTVQPNVANTPASTPASRPGSASQGRADGADPNAQAPTFSDGHAEGGYASGYTSATPPSRPKDVPASMGGDSGQSLKHPTYASRHIASREEMEHPDFQRGYKYAARWTPATPLVGRGSAELEAGIYAGFTDHPEHRAAWLAKHAQMAAQVPALGQRVALHRQFTHKVAAAQGLPTDGTYLQSQAATSTDLDTLAPGTSPDPTGGTPINGPGRPGPLAGGMDAAAPGGPAPYNGAEPMGSPVVPGGSNVPEAAAMTIPDNGMAPPQMALPPAAAAFRRRVQAGLLRERNQG